MWAPILTQTLTTYYVRLRQWQTCAMREISPSNTKMHAMETKNVLIDIKINSVSSLSEMIVNFNYYVF